MACAIAAIGTFAPIMAQAAECRSRCAPNTGILARPQARRTMFAAASLVSGRVGAVTVVNTSRKETAGRPSRSQAAIAVPTSAGSGRTSYWPPLPRIPISPAR
jgi:hypothetical protein